MEPVTVGSNSTREGSTTNSTAAAAAAAPATVYFRGRYITEALIADLKSKHGLGDATDVVIGGCSAGGLHVIAHIDAVAALLPSTARAVGYADSGFIMACVNTAACMDVFQFQTTPQGMLIDVDTLRATRRSMLLMSDPHFLGSDGIGEPLVLLFPP